jgi:uncharacterized protein YuzE
MFPLISSFSTTPETRIKLICNEKVEQNIYTIEINGEQNIYTIEINGEQNIYTIEINMFLKVFL